MTKAAFYLDTTHSVFIADFRRPQVDFVCISDTAAVLSQQRRP
jgi:hypothetical protein